MANEVTECMCKDSAALMLIYIAPLGEPRWSPQVMARLPSAEDQPASAPHCTRYWYPRVSVAVCAGRRLPERG
jgi:hypothetical protein